MSESEGGIPFEVRSGRVGVPPVSPQEAARVRGWLRWRLRNDRLTRIVEALLDEREPPPEAVEVALQSLTSGSALGWRAKCMAAWSLGRLPLRPEHHLRVLEALAGASVKPGRLPAWACCASCAYLPASPLILSYFWIQGGWVDRVRVEALRALGMRGAPGGLPAVLEAFANSSGQVRRASIEAMLRLLPRLSAAHYGTFGADVTAKLVGLLGYEDALAGAALHALGAVGHGSAAKAVAQRLERLPPGDLRETALRVLPVLEERLRRENEARTLLRPSAAPLQPETLLRPAGTGATDDERLLRPSRSSEDDDQRQMLNEEE